MTRDVGSPPPAKWNRSRAAHLQVVSGVLVTARTALSGVPREIAEPMFSSSPEPVEPSGGLISEEPARRGFAGSPTSHLSKPLLVARWAARPWFSTPASWPPAFGGGDRPHLLRVERVGHPPQVERSAADHRHEVATVVPGHPEGDDHITHAGRGRGEVRGAQAGGLTGLRGSLTFQSWTSPSHPMVSSAPGRMNAVLRTETGSVVTRAGPGEAKRSQSPTDCDRGVGGAALTCWGAAIRRPSGLKDQDAELPGPLDLPHW
ncbi:hypothetical protein [Kitasatospora sp. NPDC059327]|uniref:hypothetical protein n=1 Tax=Kitasatospora sp. NPDC059327 TaxID=3346803 RepID=UPI00369BC177